MRKGDRNIQEFPLYKCYCNEAINGELKTNLVHFVILTYQRELAQKVNLS